MGARPTITYSPGDPKTSTGQIDGFTIKHAYFFRTSTAEYSCPLLFFFRFAIKISQESEIRERSRGRARLPQAPPAANLPCFYQKLSLSSLSNNHRDFYSSGKGS